MTGSAHNVWRTDWRGVTATRFAASSTVPGASRHAPSACLSSTAHLLSLPIRFRRSPEIALDAAGWACQIRGMRTKGDTAALRFAYGRKELEQ